MRTYLSGKVAPPLWFRVAAFVALVLLPVIWIGTLVGPPDLRITNAARVTGALVGAGMVWRRRPDAASIPWGALMGGGIAGSLAVTLLSVVVPALGQPFGAGWILSGVLGGAMVGLAMLALRGAPSGG